MRLPPLNAIRAFEAAARHSSFTRSADELFVTPGAVSRQVRSLEDHFGKPLFDRGYREVTLTEASRKYAATLNDAFGLIDTATREFVNAQEEGTLNIYAPITFTLHWLVHRLGSFHSLHPQQGIRISSAGSAPVTLTGTEYDIVIRLAGADTDLDAIRLFDVDFTPACSPEYLLRNPIKSPADLLKHPLLRSGVRGDDWRKWFKLARVAGAELANEVSFPSSSLAYQAALDGHGFAMIMRPLLDKELASGDLVTPFDVSLNDGTAFHVVYPAGSETDPAVRDFLNWISSEANGTPLPEPVAPE